MRVVSLSELCYTDDVVMLGKPDRELKANINIFEKKLSNRDVKINIEKTKVMVIGRTERRQCIETDGE